MLVGAIAAVAGATAAINRLRGRPALALPEDVGRIELAAFVAIGGLLQLIGGQTTSAWVVFAANLALLGVLYVSIAYGLPSIVRFTGRRVGEQLTASVDLLARAIPLLLLFSVVLFINTEMWQVFAGMDDVTLGATAALLVAVGSAFLAVRLPVEVAAAGARRAGGPAARAPPARERRPRPVRLPGAPDPRRRRGRRRVLRRVRRARDQPRRDRGVARHARRPGVQVDLFGVDVSLTVELLRVSTGIAVLSGLYYSVAVLTDSTYREEFLEELTGELRKVFADRARYLATPRA